MMIKTRTHYKVLGGLIIEMKVVSFYRNSIQLYNKKYQRSYTEFLITVIHENIHILGKLLVFEII